MNVPRSTSGQRRTKRGRFRRSGPQGAELQRLTETRRETLSSLLGQFQGDHAIDDAARAALQVLHGRPDDQARAAAERRHHDRGSRAALAQQQAGGVPLTEAEQRRTLGGTDTIRAEIHGNVARPGAPQAPALSRAGRRRPANPRPVRCKASAGSFTGPRRACGILRARHAAVAFLPPLPRAPAARRRCHRRHRAPGRRPARGRSPASSPRPPERHGVDPNLVHAVIAVESGYRATAQSPAGAQGLMQLMPGTQRDLGVSDAFDPVRTSTPASPTCAASPTSSGPCSRWPPTTPRPAPCGATTASRHTRRRAPTCRPSSTAVDQQLPMHRRPRNRTPPETERSPRPRPALLKAIQALSAVAG